MAHCCACHQIMSGDRAPEETREDARACSGTRCVSMYASSLVASAACLSARWRLATGLRTLASLSSDTLSGEDCCAESANGELQRRFGKRPPLA